MFISKNMLKSSRKMLFFAFFNTVQPQFCPKTTPIFPFFTGIIKDYLNYLFYWRDFCSCEYHEKSLLKALEIAIFPLKISYFGYRKCAIMEHTHHQGQYSFKGIDRKFSKLSETFWFFWKISIFDWVTHAFVYRVTFIVRNRVISSCNSCDTLSQFNDDTCKEEALRLKVCIKGRKAKKHVFRHTNVTLNIKEGSSIKASKLWPVYPKI